MEITIVGTNPLTVQMAFAPKEQRALAFAAQEASRTEGRAITPREHLEGRINEYVQAMLRRYQERLTNALLERFHDATPEQQAAAIQAVGGEIPQ
ncbi:MAG TPA: hypothetical protein VM364_08085 [Vicinamibacterales bacterium]|nr:hypothetical protein [Vicinamibacterales bacterium]